MRVEDLAQNWNIPDPRNLAHLDRGVGVKEPGDAETLAIFQLNGRLSVASGDCRDRKTRDRDCVAVIERTDLWRDLQANRIVGFDGTGKVEFNAEGAELDGNGPSGAAYGSLDNRIRELTAGEEVCGFPADGHQIRLGEDLEDVLCLEILNGSAEIEVGSEEENIEQAGDTEARDGSCSASANGTGNCTRACYTTELLRRDHAGSVGGAGADDVDGEGVHLAAVDLSEADFEHDLLAMRRYVDEDGVYDVF